MIEETTGKIQKINIYGDPGGYPGGFGDPTWDKHGMVCFWIGPNPADLALLCVRRVDSDSKIFRDYKNNAVDALVTAHMHKREVTVTHEDDSNLIIKVTIEVP